MFKCKPLIYHYKIYMNEKWGCVYIIQKVDQDIYKIGYSKDPVNRLKTLQTANNDKLELLIDFYFEDAHKIEKLVHHKYKQYKLNGEWFGFSKKILGDCHRFLKELFMKPSNSENSTKFLIKNKFLDENGNLIYKPVNKRKYNKKINNKNINIDETDEKISKLKVKDDLFRKVKEEYEKFEIKWDKCKNTKSTDDEEQLKDEAIILSSLMKQFIKYNID